MATPGTTFPSSIDAPLDVTLADDTIDPDHVNSVDDRVRAVEVKVGADGDTNADSHDYKLRPWAFDQRTTQANALVTALSWTLVDGRALALHVWATGVLDGGTEVITRELAATFRMAAGTVYLVGAITSLVDHRQGMASADVTADFSGTSVRVRLDPQTTSRVHWQVTVLARTVAPGGV